jgi:hypothetical protein
VTALLAVDVHVLFVLFTLVRILPGGAVGVEVGAAHVAVLARDRTVWQHPVGVGCALTVAGPRGTVADGSKGNITLQ